MDDRIIVTIPDMFKCFVVQEPRINDGYCVAKIESEKWIAE